MQWGQDTQLYLLLNYSYGRNRQAEATGRLQRGRGSGSCAQLEGRQAAMLQPPALCPHLFRGCFACPAGKLPQGPAPSLPSPKVGWIAKLIWKPETRQGLEETHAGCHSNSTNPCHWRPPHSENTDSKALLAPGWLPVILFSGNRTASLSKISPAQSYEWKISKGHQNSWHIWCRLSIQQSQAVKAL